MEAGNAIRTGIHRVYPEALAEVRPWRTEAKAQLMPLQRE